MSGDIYDKDPEGPDEMANRLCAELAAMTERAEKAERDQRYVRVLLDEYRTTQEAAEARCKEMGDWANKEMLLLKEAIAENHEEASKARERANAVEKERDGARAMADTWHMRSRIHQQTAEFAERGARTAESRLAEVEAQAASMREALRDYVNTPHEADAPGRHCGQCVLDRNAEMALSTDAGRALLDERKSDKAKIAELQSKLDRYGDHEAKYQEWLDESSALKAELEALRAVRDAATACMDDSNPRRNRYEEWEYADTPSASKLDDLFDALEAARGG